MTKISSFGRFLDQPILTTKFEQKVPLLLSTGAGILTVNEVANAPKEKKKKVALRNIIILTATILSALKAPVIADKIIKRAGTKIQESSLSKLEQVKLDNKNTIQSILKEKEKISDETKRILEKSEKGNILNIKEVDTLSNELDFESFNRIIPEPVSVTSKDIFKEIGWLSIFGLVPVVGGITGGIIADSLTTKNWKQGINNKIKEGVYQYLANIFLCNVGAGVALFGLEKAGINSKVARCIGMIGGIILTGIIGGSYIANFISNKFINPLLSKHPHDEYRKPEVLDIGLHTDDIATVAVLSGLKWIEPALPFLYSISGYRAGIGYRNSKNAESKEVFLCKKC